ncbi:MAG TPA: hypothetical protein VF260_00670, partial [Bacilli bacterium]
GLIMRIIWSLDTPAFRFYFFRLFYTWEWRLYAYWQNKQNGVCDHGSACLADHFLAVSPDWTISSDKKGASRIKPCCMSADGATFESGV